jgi:hypothetical protein
MARDKLAEFRKKLEMASDEELIDFFDQTVHSCAIEAETPEDMSKHSSCVGASLALTELRRRNIVVNADDDDDPYGREEMGDD